MTVLAYKNGVMVADSLVVGGGMKMGTMKKVSKKGGWLAGAGGRAKDVSMFLEIFEEVIEETGEQFAIAPDAKLEDLGGLLVSPEGVVYHIDEGGIPWKSEDTCHFNGIGGEVAAGAMDAGKTAIEAAEIAINRVTGCGGKLQIVKLDSVE